MRVSGSLAAKHDIYIYMEDSLGLVPEAVLSSAKHEYLNNCRNRKTSAFEHLKYAHSDCWLIDSEDEERSLHARSDDPVGVPGRRRTPT
jgi:hypothetical protein